MRNSAALRQNLATAVGTIGIHRHSIIGIHAERLAVSHTFYRNLLTGRFSYIDLIDDSDSRIEVKIRILEAVMARRVRSVEQQQMVIGRSHNIDPLHVTVFQIILYLAALQTHGVERVLVPVELEHIAHGKRAAAKHRIVRKRRGKAHISPRFVELHLMNEIDKGARAEIRLVFLNLMLNLAHTMRDVTLYGIILRAELLEQFVTIDV